MQDTIIQAEYTNIKTVKTRNVFRIELEIPYEQSQEFLAKFGMPGQGDHQKWVALALMDKTEKGGV